MKLKLTELLIFFSVVLGTCRADKIILQNGNTIKGTVLQTNSEGLLLQCDYGTVNYELSIVKEIQWETPSIQTPEEDRTQTTMALPSWRPIIFQLSKQPWSHDLQQIPATVIDKGILKNVPYISFRCGDDYECNVLNST